LSLDEKGSVQAESRVSDIEEPPILKCAVLKKLKSNHQYKKKFFVLLGKCIVIITISIVSTYVLDPHYIFAYPDLAKCLDADPGPITI
jgi:hypothetical protein